MKIKIYEIGTRVDYLTETSNNEFFFDEKEAREAFKDLVDAVPSLKKYYVINEVYLEELNIYIEDADFEECTTAEEVFNLCDVDFIDYLELEKIK